MSSRVSAMGAPGAGSSGRDDRVLPEVRVVAPLVILILILAVLVLYLNPDKTDQYFAWTIKPALTALAMGSGYLMGIYFFARVTLAQRWHTVALGFLPITAFTILMLAATLLHLDRFHQGTYAFVLWTVVYIITPFLVPFLWWRNRATDPRRIEPGEQEISSRVRQGLGVIGVLAMLFALAAFIFPDLLIRLFPWTLTPLTARVVAGWLAFPGLGGLVLSREPRWSSWRVVIEAAWVGMLFFVLALPRAWGDLNPAKPLTWLLVAGLVAALVFTPLFYLRMERKRMRGENRKAAVNPS